MKIVSALLLLTIFTIPSIFAAQNARVVTSGAIVYAEKMLKTPIGKIKRGSVIRVGNVARNNGRALPIIVAGRVAWIKVIDLRINWFKGMDETEEFDKTPRLTEHKVLKVDKMNVEEDTDPIHENNFLTLQAHYFSYNYIVGEEYSSDEDDDPINGYSLHFSFEHRPPQKLLNWGIGLGFYNHSEEDVALSWPTLDLMLYFVPFISEKIAFDFFGGLHLSGSFRAKYRMDDNSEKDSGARALGGSVGALFRFFPTSNIGGHVGIGYQTLMLSDMEKIEYNGKSYEPGLDYLSGFTIFLGLSVHI
jgi:hypothetical protein